ncbi:hypothetical protein GIB67_042267 [Kingdonia uniflora]|uniref:protein-serine/threonine phosphatase n=1 Tax=Kingdonia uniflora TaxID=39325 RepID=A0A7J7LEB1_9MAGN|nr:hypothetical protein GIB67_042267 [Kingdonia uniflora]
MNNNPPTPPTTTSKCLNKRARNARRERQEIRRLRSKQNSNPNTNTQKMTPKPQVVPVNKILVSSRDVVVNEEKSLSYLLHGSVSVCGRRREMEDAVTIAPGFLSSKVVVYDFFGVYDGHGGSGVAKLCRERLHRVLAEEIGGGGGDHNISDVDWERSMCASFSRMDNEVNGGHEGEDQDSESGSLRTTGSTAVVAIVGIEKVVVANCGDSRAVLFHGGVAVPLSNDHKRVEAAGGRVLEWNGPRILGVLATSRSIGDYYLKPYVISKPEVTVHERTLNDEFLILASDGLWDVMTNEVACEVVRRCLSGQLARRYSKTVDGSGAAEAAAVLVELAMARGSKDNISVLVVELKRNVNGCCE